MSDLAEVKENKLVTNWYITDTVVQENCPEERVQDQSCVMGEGWVRGGLGALSHPAWGLHIMKVST